MSTTSRFYPRRRTARASRMSATCSP